MLRTKLEADLGLDRSRVHSHSAHDTGAHDTGAHDISTHDTEVFVGGTSSVTQAATLAVFAAAMIVMTPKLGPLVHEHVFAGLDRPQAGADLPTTHRQVSSVLEMAMLNKAPQRRVTPVQDADGSPFVTGSVSAAPASAGPSADAAARVISEMGDSPAPGAGMHGLRGSFGPGDSD